MPEIARAIAIEFIIVLRVEKVSREAEVDCTIELFHFYFIILLY